MKTRLCAGLVVMVALGAMAGGCGGLSGLQHRLTPGSLKKGSRIHAYQAAAFAQAFTASHARQWQATMGMLASDGAPLLKELRARRIAMDVALRERTRSKTPIYDVDLLFAGKAGKALTLHAEAGMEEATYDAGAAAVARQIGVGAAMLRKGHFAIYATAAMMTALSVSSTSLKSHAFALLVLKKKIEAGEQADYLAPTRPAEESLADIDVALRVIAAHHARTAAWRAEVLGLVALIEAAETEQGLSATLEHAAESRERANIWLRDNPPPTMDQFGVAMNELVLPTPENLLKVLDEDGYLAAAVKVAKGIATGDPRATIQGLAELAPKDTSVRTALQGISAAANGDVRGVLSSVRTLAGEDSAVGKLATRVDRVYAAVMQIKGGVQAIGATIGKPTSLGDMADRFEQAGAGAADVAEGAGKLGG